MKIYLTLNEEKEKDKLIIDYLNAQYSKTATIKDMLYQKAINAGNMPVVALSIDDGKKHQKVVESSNSAESINIVKSSKKVDLTEFI